MRILVLSLIFLLGFSQTDARKANEAYREGDYSRAAELYRQALQKDPENGRLHFNLGNSLARLGQTEEAAEAYERFRSLTNDPAEQALADYNIGNLYSDTEELNRAAEHYRNALRNNPDDADARHNYELAMRQMQQQQEQQQQEQQDQDQDQDEQESEQDQQQDQDQNNGESPPDQDDQFEQPQTPESDMSLEEAESILDALEQRERDLLRDRQKEAEEPVNDERDW